MSLTQKAMEAWAEVEAGRAEQDRRDARRIAADTYRQFKKSFGAEPQAVVGRLVKIEDLELVMEYGEYDDRPRWRQLGCCPDCGDTVPGNHWIYEPADLGASMAQWKPAHNHRCPGSADETVTDYKKQAGDKLSDSQDASRDGAFGYATVAAQQAIVLALVALVERLDQVIDNRGRVRTQNTQMPKDW